LVKQVNIYLLRHGKTNGEAGLYGHTDIDVEPELQQRICRQVTRSNLSVSHIESSPLVRCQELALQISRTLDLSLTIQEGWKEVSFGDFDGVPFSKLKNEWQTLERFWANPAQNTLPNAESLEIFHSRVTRQWQQYVDSVEEDTLIVCHGGTIRMILADVLALDWQNPALYSALSINNQSLTHIQVTKAEQHYFRVNSIGSALNE
jgi:alpha-ribazole phosphatase